MKRFRARYGVVALLTFFLLELALLLAEPYLNTGPFEFDRELGFRVRPGTWGSNRLGFLDRDRPREKAPGKFRILVLGDSFNWVGGLKGNYVALLEGRFARSHPGTVEVMNLGYPSTHTAEQLALYRRHGAAYSPDLVVLGFFTGNDYYDGDPDRVRVALFGNAVDVRKSEEFFLFGRPWLFTSRFYRLLRMKWREFSAANVVPGPHPGAGPRLSIEERTFLDIERTHFDINHVGPGRRPEYDVNIAFIHRALKELRDEVESGGAEFFVAVYPDEYHVNPRLRKKLFSLYGLDPGQFDLFHQQKVLSRFLRREGIAHFDLTPEFVEAGRGRSLYLPRNTHWNAGGRALAAALLHRELTRHYPLTRGRELSSR